MTKLYDKCIENIKEKISLHQGVYIIRLMGAEDVPIKEGYYPMDVNHNIYCINDNLDIIWAVRYELSHADNKGDPFIWMAYEEGILYANKFRGREYIIDIKTGIAELTGTFESPHPTRSFEAKLKQQKPTLTHLTQKQIALGESKQLIQGNQWIVLIAPPNDSDDAGIRIYDQNHNIYCINENYEVIWQIQAENLIQQSADHNYSDPFTYFILEDGTLRAATFSGFEYIIDVKTGKAEMTGWSK